MSYDNTIQEVRIQQTFSEAATSWILQVVGVCSAIVFGVYSILSYRDAEIARQQAETANLFSLLALCSQVGSNDTQTAQICARVSSRAQASLASIASELYPTLAPSQTSDPTLSRGSPIPASIAIGIAIPVVLTLTCLSGVVFYSTRRRRILQKQNYEAREALISGTRKSALR